VLQRSSSLEVPGLLWDRLLAKPCYHNLLSLCSGFLDEMKCGASAGYMTHVEAVAVMLEDSGAGDHTRMDLVSQVRTHVSDRRKTPTPIPPIAPPPPPTPPSVTAHKSGHHTPTTRHTQTLSSTGCSH